MMGRQRILRWMVPAILAAASPAVPRAQAPEAVAPRPAVQAIVDAFATHDLVALSDAHGDVRAQDFLRTLVAAPGFADTVNDVVVEFGNARYQDVVDRFVRGDDVPLRAVQPAFQNVVTPNQVWADEAFFAAVRAVNVRRPAAARLRVLLGDPPIDWSVVRTRADHFAWLAMRDSFPAALVQVEVLARRRKALIVYGHLHFQRLNVASNFVMSDWPAQTIVSLIERSSPQRVFTIWRLDDQVTSQLPSTALAPPRIVSTRGTPLGAADVSTITSWPTRAAFRDGKAVPIPREEWRTLPIQDQLDAVLALGPGGGDNRATVPARACAEPGFLAERLRRIALAGIPAFEADRVRQICAAAP